MPKHRKFMSFAARLTLLAFTYCFVLHEPLLAAVSLASVARESGAPSEAAAPAPGAGPLFPVSAGRVTGGRHYDTSRLVIYIQDLHCHPEVQRNIVALLHGIRETTGIDRLFVEGAPRGETAPLPLSAVTDPETRELTAREMMGKGMLSAAQYFSLSGRGVMFGLEDKDVYGANLRRLRRYLPARASTLDHAARLQQDIAGLKAEFYSARLARLERFLRRDGARSDARWYARLERAGAAAGENLRSYPSLWDHRQHAEISAALNFRALRKETPAVMRELRERAPYAEYTTVARAFTGGNPDGQALARAFAALCRYDAGAARRFPQTARYADFVGRQAQLNPVAIVEERRLFAERVLHRSARTAAEQDIVFLSRMADNYRSMAGLALTGSEYTYFIDQLPRFIALCSAYLPGGDLAPLLALGQGNDLEQFYRVNAERTGIFLATLAAAPAGGTATAASSGFNGVFEHLSEYRTVDVVIAGGFHADMAEGLDRARISHLSLTPAVTAPGDSAAYDALISGHIDVRKIAGSAFVQEFAFSSDQTCLMLAETLNAWTSKHYTARRCLNEFKALTARDRSLADYSLSFNRSTAALELSRKDKEGVLRTAYSVPLRGRSRPGTISPASRLRASFRLCAAEIAAHVAAIKKAASPSPARKGLRTHRVKVAALFAAALITVAMTLGSPVASLSNDMASAATTTQQQIPPAATGTTTETPTETPADAATPAPVTIAPELVFADTDLDIAAMENLLVKKAEPGRILALMIGMEKPAAMDFANAFNEALRTGEFARDLKPEMLGLDADGKAILARMQKQLAAGALPDQKDCRALLERIFRNEIYTLKSGYDNAAYGWTLPAGWTVDTKKNGVYPSAGNSLSIGAAGTGYSNAMTVSKNDSYVVQGMVNVDKLTSGKVTVFVEETITDAAGATTVKRVPMTVITKVKGVCKIYPGGGDKALQTLYDKEYNYIAQYITWKYAPSSAGVSSVRIGIEVEKGSNLHAYVDGIKFCRVNQETYKKLFGNARIIFRFDDGYTSHIKAAKILNDHGMPGVFNIITQSGLSKAQIAQLAKDGNQIGDHSASHDYSIRKLPRGNKRYETEIVGSKNTLEKILKDAGLNISVKSFCSPGHDGNAIMKAMIMGNFESSQERVTWDGKQVSGFPVNPYDLPTVGQGLLSKLSETEGLVDSAIKNNSIQSFMIHGLVNKQSPNIYTQITWDFFNKLVDYVDSKGDKVTVSTFDQLLADQNKVLEENKIINSDFGDKNAAAKKTAAAKTVSVTVPDVPAGISAGLGSIADTMDISQGGMHPMSLPGCAAPVFINSIILGPLAACFKRRGRYSAIALELMPLPQALPRTPGTETLPVRLALAGAGAAAIAWQEAAARQITLTIRGTKLDITRTEASETGWGRGFFYDLEDVIPAAEAEQVRRAAANPAAPAVGLPGSFEAAASLDPDAIFAIFPPAGRPDSFANAPYFIINDQGQAYGHEFGLQRLEGPFTDPGTGREYYTIRPRIVTPGRYTIVLPADGKEFRTRRFMLRPAPRMKQVHAAPQVKEAGDVPPARAAISPLIAAMNPALAARRIAAMGIPVARFSVAVIRYDAAGTADLRDAWIESGNTVLCISRAGKENHGTIVGFIDASPVHAVMEVRVEEMTAAPVSWYRILLTPADTGINQMLMKLARAKYAHLNDKAFDRLMFDSAAARLIADLAARGDISRECDLQGLKDMTVAKLWLIEAGDTQMSVLPEGLVCNRGAAEGGTPSPDNAQGRLLNEAPAAVKDPSALTAARKRYREKMETLARGRLAAAGAARERKTAHDSESPAIRFFARMECAMLQDPNPSAGSAGSWRGKIPEATKVVEAIGAAGIEIDGIFQAVNGRLAADPHAVDWVRAASALGLNAGAPLSADDELAAARKCYETQKSRGASFGEFLLNGPADGEDEIFGAYVSATALAQVKVAAAGGTAVMMPLPLLRDRNGSISVERTRKLAALIARHGAGLRLDFSGTAAADAPAREQLLAAIAADMKSAALSAPIFVDLPADRAAALKECALRTELDSIVFMAAEVSSDLSAPQGCELQVTGDTTGPSARIREAVGAGVPVLMLNFTPLLNGTGQRFPLLGNAHFAPLFELLDMVGNLLPDSRAMSAAAFRNDGKRTGRGLARELLNSGPLPDVRWAADLLAAMAEERRAAAGETAGSPSKDSFRNRIARAAAQSPLPESARRKITDLAEGFEAPDEKLLNASLEGLLQGLLEEISFAQFERSTSLDLTAAGRHDNAELKKTLAALAQHRDYLGRSNPDLLVDFGLAPSGTIRTGLNAPAADTGSFDRSLRALITANLDDGNDRENVTALLNYLQSYRRATSGAGPGSVSRETYRQLETILAARITAADAAPESVALAASLYLDLLSFSCPARIKVTEAAAGALDTLSRNTYFIVAAQ